MNIKRRVFVLWLLLVACCLGMSSLHAQEVEFTSSITKGDIICGPNSGVVDLVLTPKVSGAEINGDAGLRKVGVEGVPLDASGETLQDRRLEGFDDEGTKKYLAQWQNVAAGEYDLYVFVGDKKIKCNDKPIVIVDEYSAYAEHPVKIEVDKRKDIVYPYMLHTQWKGGAIKVKSSGGEGPFVYKAVVMRGGKQVETLTSASPTGREYEFSFADGQLHGGDQVQLVVEDLRNGRCEQTRFGAEKMVDIDGLHLKLNVKQRLYRVVKNGCEIDTYVKVWVNLKSSSSCENPTAVREYAKAFLSTGFKVKKGGESFETEVVEGEPYSEITDVQATYYLKVKGDFVPEGFWGYECINPETDEKEERKVLSQIHSFGGDVYGGFPMVIMKPSVVLEMNEECEVQKQVCEIVYTLMPRNQEINGVWCYFDVTQYYFPEEAQFRVERLDEENSQWKELSDVSAPLHFSPFEGIGKTRSINLSKYGVGKYRVSYDGGCEQTKFEREIEIKAPEKKPEFVDLNQNEELKTDKVYTSYGGTAAAIITLKGDFRKHTNVIIEREDGKDEVVSDISDFLTPEMYQHTSRFPVVIEDAEFHYNEAEAKSVLFLSDLPKGKYLVTVEHCGGRSTKAVTIADTKVYAPKQDEGYTDGMLVKKGCDKNVVLFDFGARGYLISFSNGIPWTEDWTAGSSSSSSENRTSSKGIFKFEREETGNYSFEFQLGGSDLQLATSLSNYSTIAHEYLPKALVTDLSGPRANTFCSKVFRVHLEAGAGGAFLVSGAKCSNDKTAADGTISVGVQPGFMPGFPVKYEFWKSEKQSDGGIRPLEEIGAKIISADDGKGNVKYLTGLEQGWYTVKCYSNYHSETDHCSPMVKHLYLESVDIPKIDADWTVKCYGEGLAPNQLVLPVSPYMYDVEWYRGEDKVGEGVKHAATFDKPGLYTYTVKTMFHEGTSCAGSSGGERNIVIDVQDCSGEPAVNLWLGTEGATDGDDYFVAQNWTLNHVPMNGENVVFATAANNEGVAAKRDCVIGKHYEGVGYDNPRVLHIGTYENRAEDTGKKLEVHGTRLEVDGEMGDNLLLDYKPDAEGYPGELVWAKSAINGDHKGWSVSYKDLWTEKDPTFNGTPAIKKTEDKIETSPTYGREVSYYDIPWRFSASTLVTPVKVSDEYSDRWAQGYDETHNAPNNYYAKWHWMKGSDELASFVGYQVSPLIVGKGGVVENARLQFEDGKATLTRQAAAVTGAKHHDAAKTGEELTVAERHWGLGQNVLGNSYPASLLIENMEFPAEVDPTVYLYKGGSFANWMGGQGHSAQGEADHYIALPKNAAKRLGVRDRVFPSEGFLVKFTDGETQLGTEVEMHFSYDMVRSKSNETKRVAVRSARAEAREGGSLMLTLSNGALRDELFLLEEKGTTRGWDRGWDGKKLNVYAPLCIYGRSEDGELQVSATDSIVQTPITVVLPAAGEYALNVVKKGLAHYDALSLVDRVAHKVIALTGDATHYEFTASAPGTVEDRFALVNVNEITGIDDVLNDGSEIADGARVRVYDMNGRCVLDYVKGDVTKDLKQVLLHGVYVVWVEDGNGIKTYCVSGRAA